MLKVYVNWAKKCWDVQKFGKCNKKYGIFFRNFVEEIKKMYKKQKNLEKNKE